MFVVYDAVWWHDLVLRDAFLLLVLESSECEEMLWNAVFSDEPKFVSGQENGNLGNAKMEV
jgi:hypothetical protein